MNETRIESDSIGEIEVPAAAYWGAQTERSRHNFAFPPHERMPLPIVHALARIKVAAARVNRNHGLDAALADAIAAAADAVAAGEYDDQFPLAIWQTGSGTQSNMNANEVVAGIANEKLAGTRGGKAPVHPNDHVNMGQSSNDSFPTALHVAVAVETTVRLLPALAELTDALAAKAAVWHDIVKIGRTHLQDATPLTLGQEFSGYVAQLVAARARIEGALAHNVCKLAQGGTAVGTGLNAPPGFDVAMAAELSKATGIAFEPAPNKFEALASNDGLVFFSGALNALAVALTKIPATTQRIGKSSSSVPARVSPWKLRWSTRHLRNSAVKPPATIRPVAGHMTHKRMSFFFATSTAGMIPYSCRSPGATIHERIKPITMFAQMRTPMIMPEPMLKRPSEKPTPVAL